LRDQIFKRRKIMKMNTKKSITLMAAFVLLLASVGCGGGGGDSVTYNGNTDPAVADSTTATPLAQAGLNASSAGFPVVQAFFTQEPGAESSAASLAAQPLVAYDGTYVTVQIPSGAVIDGAAMGGGDGTMTLAGTITMWVEDRSAGGTTWTISTSTANATMNGTVKFNGYYNGIGGPEEMITGTVTVADTSLEFSNAPIEFPSADIGSVLEDYVELPIFTDIAITFTHLTVGTGSDSYSLGEGDMEFTLAPPYIDLNIYSLTAEGGGESYHLEDTNVYVEFISDGDDITVQGIESDYATVFHPTLGQFYFYAELTEEDPPGDITSGYLEISEDGVDSKFRFYVDYDDIYGTYYNSFTDGGGGDVLVEKGYLTDWEFIPNAGAPDIE
jgi:hypothetical protein